MLIGASLEPNNNPDSATNIHCNVKGTIGEGMVIFEPIVMRATKSETIVISFVVSFNLIILPIVNYI